MKNFGLMMVITTGLTCFAFQVNEGSVQGRVLDLQDHPIGDASLTFTNDGDPGWEKTVTTRGNGRFILNRLKNGTVTVVAKKAGFVTRTTQYTQEQRGMKINIYMVKEGETIESLGPQPRISGSLEDSQGKPVDGARVTLTTDLFPDLERSVETDKKGGFELEGLANADLRLYMKKDGYRDLIHQFTQFEDDFKVETLSMQTLEEAAAELGIELSKKKRTPKDQAVDFYNAAVEPYQAENFAQAEEFAKKAVELDPSLDPALKMLVFTNYKLGDWDDVATYAGRYLEKKPDDQNVAQIALEAADKTQDPGAGEALKGKLKDLGAMSPDVLFNRAVEALNGHDDESARKHLEEVLNLDKSYARAYYELGKIDIREGEFEAAILNLKYFLKHAPKGDPLRAEVTELIVTLSE